MKFQKEYIFISIWMSLVVLVAASPGSGDGIVSDPWESSSDYDSSSDIGPVEDRNPCSFRRQFLLHKQEVRLDPCTHCWCTNGTTNCQISSCSVRVPCLPPEIPEVCCPLCRYRMTVENIYNLHHNNFEFADGDSRRITFGIDVKVAQRYSSEIVRGVNLWKLSAWLSRHRDGSGEKFSFKENVFDKKDAAKEFNESAYRNAPWQWPKLNYTMNFTGGTLDDYKYFCVEFDQADDPVPLYGLPFNVESVDNEHERLVDCVELGVTAEWLDWTLRAENAAYGQSTPVSLSVEVIFTRESAHMKRHGEGLWRVALFGSSEIDGSGPRFSEIRQVLDMEDMATRKKGRNLTINDIAANFEIGTIGCTGDVQYVCVEFAQGDTADPRFRMTINTSTNTLIKCKEQECSSYISSSAPDDIYSTDDTHPTDDTYLTDHTYQTGDTSLTDDTHTAIPLTVILVLIVSLLALALLVGTLLIMKWRKRNRLPPRSSGYKDAHLLDEVTS